MTQFSVSPGGPPDVTLVLGGVPGYPGVIVRNEGTGPVPPQNISVTLPPGGGLQFESEGGTQYLLTVFAAGGSTTQYNGNLSASGQSLAFSAVDLAIGVGAQAVIWVAVSASPNARVGYTALQFVVGSQASSSNPIIVG
jgi:hypothetical protein